MGRGPIDAVLICDADVDEMPAEKRHRPAGAADERCAAPRASQIVRLEPPPAYGDYVYQMHRDEGVADLFAVS